MSGDDGGRRIRGCSVVYSQSGVGVSSGELSVCLSLGDESFGLESSNATRSCGTVSIRFI